MNEPKKPERRGKYASYRCLKPERCTTGECAKCKHSQRYYIMRPGDVYFNKCYDLYDKYHNYILQQRFDYEAQRDKVILRLKRRLESPNE